MKTLKIYKVICSDFGHKFSFNAKDEVDAKKKFNNWLNYHSYRCGGFKIEETTEEKYMHNEYVS